VHGWTDILRSIRATDPYHRPLTLHPTAINQYTARHATDDASLLDFDFLQTPHGQREAVPVTVKAVRDSYNASPTLPVINGEAAYEMLSDSLPTAWTRAMFWICLTNGACGHTYGANGIWQCNRKGEPHGPSPHHQGGNGYGLLAWDDAMRLPGSEQMGFGRRFFESLPWTELTPMPPSVAWGEPAPGGAKEDPLFAPQGCGIADRIRVAYVIAPRSIVLRNLRAAARYRLTCFDPVKGERTPHGEVGADAQGALRVDPPKGDHDWVCLLEVE